MQQTKVILGQHALFSEKDLEKRPIYVQILLRKQEYLLPVILENRVLKVKNRDWPDEYRDGWQLCSPSLRSTHRLVLRLFSFPIESGRVASTF